MASAVNPKTIRPRHKANNKMCEDASHSGHAQSHSLCRGNAQEAQSTYV